MSVQDVTPTVGSVMAAQSTLVLRTLPSPLRGRAIVEELPRRKSIIVTRADKDDEEVWYIGRVLALGAPARMPRVYRDDRWVGGGEMPWDVDVGDAVLFQPSMWLDRMRTFRFLDVKGRVWMLGQEEILAVVA